MGRTDDNILLLKNKLEDGLAIPNLDISEGERKQSLEPQVWAYMGAAGGVGVTSLAIQTAYELAEKHKNVCLIDLDFERGTIAAYLDTTPSLCIEDLNAGEGRMDEALAATFVQNYGKNLSLVAPDGELGGNDLVRPDAVLTLLDVICQMYDYVVLDIPPMWRPWTQAAIGAADKFAIVTEMRVPSLHRTRKLSTLIAQALSLSSPVDILLNKYERRTLLNAVSLKDAQNVLNRNELGQICEDEETVRTAINCGQAAGHANSESRYVKSVESHVQNWLGEEAMPEKQSSSIFPMRLKRDRRRA